MKRLLLIIAVILGIAPICKADQYKAVTPLLGYYQFMDKFFTPHYLLDIVAAREQRK